MGLNLTPMIPKVLKVQDRDSGAIVPYVPNWAQEHFLQTFHDEWNANKPVRIIVLKARQLGISTASEALMFLLALHLPDYPGLVVSHERPSAEHLLGITKRYWKYYPFRKMFKEKYRTRTELAWDHSDGGVNVMTAKNLEGGRSQTIRYLHASEVGFWPNGQTLMTGLGNTIPDAPQTVMILESTANGIGNYFYEQWTAAEAGESDYVPLFYPWWKHPRYTASYVGVEYITLKNMDQEERLLKKMGVDDDHLRWRRYQLRNKFSGDLEKFRQEMPATPEEAFITSGANIFPIRKLARCYEQRQGIKGRIVEDTNTINGVRWQPDIEGPLTLFAYPNPDNVYYLGGDPTWVTKGDYACIQIINRRTWEQVGVWRGKIDPLGFAQELAKVGHYFNHAEIAPEATGPGYGTIGRLVEMEYPYLYKPKEPDKVKKNGTGKAQTTFGWNTTHKSKEWAIGHLLNIIVERDLLIHDAQTFKEMRDYVRLPNGQYGPAGDQENDDTVMALAIACICSAVSAPVDPFPQRTGTGLVLPQIVDVADAEDPSFWASDEGYDMFATIGEN